MIKTTLVRLAVVDAPVFYCYPYNKNVLSSSLIDFLDRRLISVIYHLSINNNVCSIVKFWLKRNLQLFRKK